MPALALRGRVMAKGGYTFDEVMGMSELKLRFIDHYQQKQEIDFVEKICTILGLNWDMDELAESQAAAPPNNSKIFIPLSLVIEPDLLANLRKNRKESTVVPDGTAPAVQAKSLDQVPEEQLPAFLQRPKRK